MINIVVASSEVGRFIDVDEQPVERNVSDGFLEEDVDDRRRVDGT